METRRNIHNTGRSMNVPQPNKKNLKRRFAGNHLKKDTIHKKNKIMPQIQKQCVTSECVWCATKFETESIRCRVCGNCQYCGMFCVNASSCMLCGNQLPHELKQPRRNRIVKFNRNDAIIQNIRRKRKNASQ